jgi:hypothetical protein
MNNKYEVEGDVVTMIVCGRQVLFDLEFFPKIDIFKRWELSRGKAILSRYQKNGKRCSISLHKLIIGSKFVKWLNGNVFDYRRENLIALEYPEREHPRGIYLKGNKYRIDKEVVVVEIKCKGKIYEAYIDYDDYPLISKYTWNTNDDPRAGYAKSTERVGESIKGVNMHRLILGITGTSIIVDHINGNKLDNRKCNLRVCKQVENCHNQYRHRDGTVGITKSPYDSWDVHLRIDGVSHRRRVKTFEDAVALYDKWQNEFNPSGLHVGGENESKP